MERTNLQPSFLDHLTSHLGGKRTSALLGRVNEVIDWHAVAAPVRALPEYQAKASDPGRRPWEASLMVRCLFLAKCYNLSDPQLEEQLSDRMSFRRFVGLSLDDVTPDETSFVVFRNRLREAGLHDAVFYGVLGQKELSPWQKKFNKLVSKIRARVEHPFAWMSKVGFTRIRYRGLERNMVDYAMVLTAWNVRRAITLLR